MFGSSSGVPPLQHSCIITKELLHVQRNSPLSVFFFSFLFFEHEESTCCVPGTATNRKHFSLSFLTKLPSERTDNGAQLPPGQHTSNPVVCALLANKRSPAPFRRNGGLAAGRRETFLMQRAYCNTETVRLPASTAFLPVFFFFFFASLCTAATETALAYFAKKRFCASESPSPQGKTDLTSSVTKKKKLE